MRRWLLGAALLAAPNVAAADEPTGCSAFKWPLDHERAALTSSQKSAVSNSGALGYDAAEALKLLPLAEAALPLAPERAPKSQPSYAGHFTLPAPSAPGRYKITISSEGWIDVVDNGAFLHPKGFSGALGCEGARKSVKFDLPARPLDLQVSGVKNGEIGLIVTPDR